jgi:hypothetical protein
MKPRLGADNSHNGAYFDRFEQHIAYLRECPVCRAAYGKGRIDRLYIHKNVQLVHLTCPKCQNMLVAVLATSRMGVSSVGMLTDLNAADMLRTREEYPVSEDDVLDFHSLMAQQPQQFVHLFRN